MLIWVVNVKKGNYYFSGYFIHTFMLALFIIENSRDNTIGEL